MKNNRGKKITTSQERQKHASRRNVRAKKDADSIAQMAADDLRVERPLIEKLKRDARKRGGTGPPKY
jgi:hypothetical protein